jgi:hypothetical protein
MRELRAIVGARRALGGFDRSYPTQPINAWDYNAALNTDG